MSVSKSAFIFLALCLTLYFPKSYALEKEGQTKITGVPASYSLFSGKGCGDGDKDKYCLLIVLNVNGKFSLVEHGPFICDKDFCYFIEYFSVLLKAAVKKNKNIIIIGHYLKNPITEEYIFGKKVFFINQVKIGDYTFIIEDKITLAD